MVPWVSNEAEAVIALEGRSANVILVKGRFCFDLCSRPNVLRTRFACFEDFALGFNSAVVDFILPKNEIGRSLVAKLSANFLVSS